MNPALEKMLRDCAQPGFYGVVEIHYVNGQPNHVEIKKTYKLVHTQQEKNSRLENRRDENDRPTETRSYGR